MVESITETDRLNKIKNEEEILWINPKMEKVEMAHAQSVYSFADIQDIEDRFQRFAAYFEVAFPETKQYKGLLESEITKIKNMQEWLEGQYDTTLPGDFYIKRDDLLHISVTIKSR